MIRRDVGSVGGGGSSGGVGRGGMTVEGDVVGSDNVGGHDETHCREKIRRGWEMSRERSGGMERKGRRRDV